MNTETTGSTIILTRNFTHVPADGATAVTFTATVTDSNNIPVSGAFINWSQGVAEHATITPSVNVTDSNGKALAQVTNKYAEEVTISASTDDTISNLVIAHFESIDRKPKYIALSVDRRAAEANGHAAIILTAIVTDDDNQPVSGATVNWHHNSSHAVLANLGDVPTVITDKNGRAVATLIDDASETVSLYATAAIGPTAVTSDALDVSFFPYRAKLTASLNRDSAPADGISSIIATITLTDNLQNPVPNARISWQQWQGGYIQAVANKVYTDVNGQVTIIFTATTADTYEIQAIADAHAYIPYNQENLNTRLASNSLVLSYTSVTHPGSVPAKITVTTNSTTDPADINLMATVTDANNIPVPGVPVAWRCSGPANDFNIDHISNITDSEGKVYLTLTGTAEEKLIMIATVGSITSLPMIITLA